MQETTGESTNPAASRLTGEWISAVRLLRLLSSYGDALGEDSSTVYLAPGAELDKARHPTQVSDWRKHLNELGPLALESGCGLVGLRSGNRGVIVAPPFPVTESLQVSGWEDGPLRRLLTEDFNVGVVLVRLGRFSVAVYEGSRLVSSKTDSRYVKGKHHAGGTSQLRFQRVREGQMRRLYDKTCAAVRAQLGPVASRLNYVLLGGDKFTLNGCLKVCPALADFGNITLNRRLNIRDPKRDTLNQVGLMLRESRVWTVGW
jgi:hypothetical protein